MAEADNTLGTKFCCQQEHLVTSVGLRSLILYHFFFFFFFFHDFTHVYSPRAGADSPHGTKVWCQKKCLVTSFICCQFQKNVFEVRFYTLFLFLLLFIYLFIYFLLIYLFIYFHDLIHVYSPGAGTDSPQGTKCWCQQKGLITLPICCKFQRNLFEVWFYTFFFMI